MPSHLLQIAINESGEIGRIRQVLEVDAVLTDDILIVLLDVLAKMMPKEIVDREWRHAMSSKIIHIYLYHGHIYTPV